MIEFGIFIEYALKTLGAIVALLFGIFIPEKESYQYDSRKDQ